MAKTILLVEDSHDDEIIFREIMRKSRLTNPLVVVHDGGEAIAYLKGEGAFADRSKHPMPEILLLDLKLPHLSGFQVLEWIKTQEQLRKLLIVVLSHFGETQEINRAYNLGAHSFLTKPITEEDLINLTRWFTGYWERVSNCRAKT